MFTKLSKGKKSQEKAELLEKGTINDELIYEIFEDNTCFIIDKKNNETIFKLKFKDEIESIICLDNKDLLFEQKIELKIEF